MYHRTENVRQFTFRALYASRSDGCFRSCFFSMPFNTDVFSSAATSVASRLVWTMSEGKSSKRTSFGCRGFFGGFFRSTPSTLVHPIARQNMSKSLASGFSSASDTYSGSSLSFGFLNMSKMSTDGGGKPDRKQHLTELLLKA